MIPKSIWKRIVQNKDNNVFTVKYAAQIFWLMGPFLLLHISDVISMLILLLFGSYLIFFTIIYTQISLLH